MSSKVTEVWPIVLIYQLDTERRWCALRAEKFVIAFEKIEKE